MPARGIFSIWFSTAACMVVSNLAGCNRSKPDYVQGYAEGEYVHVSSPVDGMLMTLSVARGQQVSHDQFLFKLDPTPAQAARDEAQRRLAEARSRLEDARKGQRPSEIQSLESLRARAQAALEFSQRDYERLLEASESAAASKNELDRARTLRDLDQQELAKLEADLVTARLGQREDAVAAAEEEVFAREAALTAAQWRLDETEQKAPQAGVVFDTLFREGEWVPAGRPIVSLLPPANIKVRAFVPEADIGSIQLGDSATVSLDGVAATLAGKVSFISPRAEYTPPVIYSRESRSKLVFMVEIVFEPNDAATLHPGQPVEVKFEP